MVPLADTASSFIGIAKEQSGVLALLHSAA